MMIPPQICEVPSITVTWIDPQGISRPLNELPFYVQADGMTDKERFERSGTFTVPEGVRQIFVKEISNAHYGGD